MLHHYKDIVDILGEPEWWDEAGVPRYCDFGPNVTNNVYCDEVAFLEIACQNCGHRFHVAVSRSFGDQFPELRELITNDAISYGDPPNYGCCQAGPTMNSDTIRVLEYWRIDDKFEFRRYFDLPGQEGER